MELNEVPLMIARFEPDPHCHKLREAAQLLSSDYSYSQAFKFEDFWELILAAIESMEPCSRMLGLKALEMVSNDISRTLTASASRTRLVTCLTDLVAGGEQWEERTLSARMLGATVPLMMAPDFPQQLRYLAFQTVFSQFLILFPADFDQQSEQVPFFDIRTYTTTQSFQSRISYIGAISRFFAIPEANTLSFLNYIDRIFVAILTSNAHHFLVAAVIRALALQLQPTNRNRLRIEHLYRGCIRIAQYLDGGPEIKLEQTAVVAPRPSLLTLNLKPPVIEFTTAPHHMDIFLENTSQQHEEPFSVHAYPPEFFRVTPAFGVVGRGESVSVNIKFIPKPYAFRKTALDRITLSALNTPSIKIVPPRIDFGFCPKDEVRTACFTITNLMPVECPVVMVINPAVSRGAFSLPNTQVMLAPRDHKTITVKCHGVDNEYLEDMLVLVSFGCDVTRIPLTARCSRSLHVLEQSIDFGPTDIYFSPVNKRINLHNLDSLRPLPVSFQTSTHELTINRNEPVLLKPGERRSINVEFLSAMSGVRHEDIRIFAPNSAPAVVEVKAFSGPTILLPVIEDIYFSTTSVGVSVSTRIPITSLGASNSQLLIYVPNGYPVVMHAMESDYSNRKLNMPNVVVDAKPYGTPEHTGLQITLSMRMTMTIEIEFKCSIAGKYRIPLYTQMIKPKPAEISVHNLFFIVVDDPLLSAPKALAALRQFSTSPQMQPLSAVALFKSPATQTAAPPKSPRSNASEIFELSPTSQTIFGSTSKARPTETLEFVTLKNLTKETQRYHIIFSSPFVTQIPLEGELPSNTEIDIPIRLDPGFYATSETRQHTVIGFVTVLDANYNHPGFVSTHLYGIMGDLVWLELREGTRFIKFPNARPMETHTRKIIVRNKSMFDIMWEGVLSAADPSTIGAERRKSMIPTTISQTASSSDGWMPFVLTTAKVNLKPFEYCFIDMTFTSNQMGQYCCKLLATYLDPVEHLDDRHQGQRTRQRRSMGSWFFECSVGVQELLHSPECLNFGEVALSDTVERTLSFGNNGSLDVDVVLAPSSLITPKRLRLAVQPKTKVELPVTFSPLKNAFLAEMLAFSICGITHSIPVIGFAGVFGIGSSICQPLALGTAKPNYKEMAPLPEATIDFGFVNTQTAKIKSFSIRNTGTLDAILASFVSGDSHLTWDVPDAQDDLSLIPELDPVFGRERPDSLETDWDEIDFKVDQDRVERQERSVKQDASARVANNNNNTGNNPNQQQQLSKMKRSKIGGTQMFPLRLPASQCLRFNLKFSGHDKGDYICPLKLDVEKTREEVHSFVWWVKASLQPPLHLWERKIDFGIKAVNTQHKAQIRFTNTGTKPLAWKLQYQGSRHTAIAKYDPPELPQDTLSIPNAIAIFPEKGKLKPGATQAVDVIFTPNMAQYELLVHYKLLTEDFAETSIYMQGIGASSCLVLDSTSLEFGTLRVGTQRVFRLNLRNRGILQAKFFVESSHPQYHADPEQGKLEADAQVELVVKFLPKAVGLVRGSLKISSISEEGHRKSPLTVALSGIGSYPELVVLTRLVDFSTALFKNPNRRVIKVQNKGAAEAHVAFSCFHPDITLETGSGKELIIEPHETKDLIIIYTPQIVERLDAKAFMRSSDSRGENFMITLKGSVGIPRLTITPFDALENLDFGVMKLQKMYRKTFKISNDGNIFLNYKVNLVPVAQSQIEVEVDLDGPIRRPAQNVPVPITVEPSAGTLGVGEETTMTISFFPTMLIEYEYTITLVYDFQSFSGTIHGIGGRALLKLDSPLKTVDFGLSRLNRTYLKIVSLSNKGNLGFRYHVRPHPDEEGADWSIYDSELATLAVTEAKSRPTTAAIAEAKAAAALQPISMDDEEPFWLKYLTRHGIRIHNPDGNCPPRGKLNLIIEFQPKVIASVLKPVRVYFGDHFEAFDIMGSGDTPRLYIRDTKSGLTITTESSPKINIGVHPVNLIYTHLFEIVNDGAFGVDYLVQPMSNTEFDVFPLRGFIEAGGSSLLKVFFQPNSENLFHTTLKLLWEGKSLTAQIVGNGGVGRLEVSYMDDKDLLLKGLDFGMVPFNSACEKRFFLLNTGMVGVTAFLEVENEEYTITQFGDAFLVDDAKKPRQAPKGLIFSWYNAIKAILPPNRGIELGARFLARSATTSVGNITIRSDCGNLMVPLKGKGGTISLSHRGDLDFGDISCNFTYTRKITIVNGGSIPSQLSAEWLIVGHSTDHASALVKLTENYTPLDPRSGWARMHYLRERGISDMKRQLKAREYWALIGLLVKKAAVKESELGRGSVVGRYSDANMPSGIHITAGSGQGNFSRLGMVMPSVGTQASIKRSTPAFSMHFKRRQMFYHLITSTQLTSQSSSRLRPFVKVDPPSTLLPSYGEAVFSVELHLGTEDTFLATLLIKSDVPNTPTHEISLTATPKIVNIICDDTRMLNFYRQPLGETEYITRSFTNVGHKDITYKFVNNNSGLMIVPSKGTLKVNQTTSITFAFKPVDESVQSSDVIFEPNCSQHIRFRMYGGGGYAKASLSRYRRFDFGHCMIGKDTVSFLPITNEGNAILHLVRFEIVETDTFFRGQDWPETRVSLFPGKTYNLPLVFNPHEENPTPGRLIIGTNTEIYEIELIGLGREAVLIVSKVALEFSECLIGNSYEQKLGLKNIGDVNYPVTFQLEREFPDLEFYPPSLVIDPFSESFVAISYTPSHETKTTVVFSVSSPYSTHKVPVMVHAGIATLEFNSSELDFGMFERTTKPSVTLTVKNTGTVRTSYHIKDVVKPSMFHLTNGRGMLPAGRSANVTITHIRHEVAEFEEKLVVKTDLIEKFYYIKVIGQCEETVLHPEEFSLVNMGICPVLEATTKPLSFKNHGRFPLDYSIKAAYPLKVFPTQGQVLGGESGTINIQWNPSGGYELRTQISMLTNIGKFQIVVRGKAMFPEIHVNNMYLDFGICAAGFTYREPFQIENKGKVPVHFTIPPCKESSYTTSISSGLLAPKEIIPVEVYFTPATVGKITSSVMVECKGIHYKEIVVVGVGGVMKVDVHPMSIDVGRCPFGLRIYETITITNGGDVTLFVDFSATDAVQQHCEIMVPDPVSIGPRRSAKCIIGFSTSVVGHFSANLRFNTKEQSFSIPISGRSKDVLEHEQLMSIREIDPFSLEPDNDTILFCMKRLQQKFQMDLRIAQQLAQLYFVHRKIESPNTKTQATPAEDASRTQIRKPIGILKREELMNTLDTIGTLTPDVAVDIRKIDSVFDEFIALKKVEYMPPADPDDAVLYQVINHGLLKIEELDIEPILVDQEPATEIDFSILTNRPPPFGHDDTIVSSSSHTKDYRRAYLSVFPSLRRDARNAKSDPFTDWSEGVIYGRGVELHPPFN
eukprot:jgi/Hompol1/4680/HPOL_000802-RA